MLINEFGIRGCEGSLTFCKLVDSILSKVYLLRVWAEIILQIPKEVFSNLGLAKLLKVFLVPVDAAA